MSGEGEVHITRHSHAVVFFGPQANNRKRLAVLFTYREILKARAAVLWRHPLKVRSIYSKDDRALALIERLKRRLSDAGNG